MEFHHRKQWSGRGVSVAFEIGGLRLQFIGQTVECLGDLRGSLC